MDSALPNRQEDVTLKLQRIAAWNGGRICSLGYTRRIIASIVGDSLQCSPEEEQRWELLK